MFKKQPPIIFIGLCVVIAALVLGWSVFVKEEVVVPVQAPVVMDDDNQNGKSDEVIDDSSDVEDDVVDDDISEIDTLDWKTYRNKECGFEIKYPKELISWEASYPPEKVEIMDVGFGVGNMGGSVLMIKIIDMPLQELPDYDRLYKLHDDSINDKIKIGNLTGTKFLNYQIGIEKNKHSFLFSSHHLREEDEKIFNQMLSTFKFIESYNHKTFQSDRLKISFEYPTEWQNLLESEGDFSKANAIHPSRIRISIGNLKDNPVILEADNGGDRMGRGRFTGDIVIDVDSQDYIKNFCQNQENKNINKCEFKVNSNNINFVKYEDELCREGGCFGKGLFYLIYNPNSEYQGILLYTYNIQKDKTAPNSEEEIIFDSLIDSLKFGK